MSRRIGYWRDACVRKHNRKRKVPWYGGILAEIESKPKKRRKLSKTKKRILVNGQWKRVKNGY